MIRLVPDHSARIERAPVVTFTFDGERLTGHAGESLAAALIRLGRRHLRDSPEDGAPRGAFCLMGLCQECTVLVNGAKVESCRVALHDGLAVASLRSDKNGRTV